MANVKTQRGGFHNEQKRINIIPLECGHTITLPDSRRVPKRIDCPACDAIAAETARLSRADARLIAAAPALLAALADLREAATDAYKAGRIAAEPFVRAGNVIADARASLGARPAGDGGSNA